MQRIGAERPPEVQGGGCEFGRAERIGWGIHQVARHPGGTGGAQGVGVVRSAGQQRRAALRLGVGGVLISSQAEAQHGAAPVEVAGLQGPCSVLG